MPDETKALTVAQAAEQAKKDFETKTTTAMVELIGQNFPKEVLAQMIEKEVQKLFFSPKTIPNPEYTGPYCGKPSTVVAPSFIEGLLVDKLQSTVEEVAREVLEKFIAENPEEVLGKIAALMDLLVKQAVSSWQPQFVVVAIEHLKAELNGVFVDMMNSHGEVPMIQ